MQRAENRAAEKVADKIRKLQDRRGKQFQSCGQGVAQRPAPGL
jgi:hypothetical protein